MEVPVHCFLRGEDPFSQGELTDSQSENKEEVSTHLTHIFTRQQRTHLFGLVFVGELLRVIRVDRASILVTHPEPYAKTPTVLLDFLMRFSSLTLAERGHDPTAFLVVPGSEMYTLMLTAANRVQVGAVDHARLCFKASLDPCWPWWRLIVPGPGKTLAALLVGKPHYYKKNMRDRRGARGYVALLLSEPGHPFVYLKDCWRWVQMHTPSEGDTLARLNAVGVRNVPTLIYHSDLFPQYIDMKYTLETALGRRLKNGDTDLPNLLYSHYRIVVREVCMRLTRFRNGRELVQIVRDCVEGAWLFHSPFRALTHSLHVISTP